MRLLKQQNNLLSIVTNASVQFQNVLPDEPDQVAKVRRGRLVPYKLEHVRVLNFVHIQRDRANRDPNHRLRMVKELDGLRIEREVIGVFIVEKVYRVRVQLQTECLQKQNIISHHIFVRKVKFMDDNRVDQVVTEEVICKSKRKQ